jgi:hypothetical protein
VKVVTNRAKSTWAWYPGAVSNLTSKGFGWPDRRHEALYGGVGAAIALLPDLTGDPDRGQLGKGRDALTQIVEIGRQLVRPADLARTIGWRLKCALDVFAHRLWIAARYAEQ